MTSEDNNYTFIPIPEESTFLGTGDMRIILRNIVFDALLGPEVDQMLVEQYGLTPLSEEGVSQMRKDSNARLGRVAAAMQVIMSVAEAMSIMAVDYIQPDLTPEQREKVTKAYADLMSRCCLASLSEMVDIGMFTLTFPPVEGVDFHDSE